MAALAGGRLGQYQVLEEIGRGGMAAVYRAYHPRQDRFVALKVLAPHLSSDPNFEERFRRETELLTQLAHPNIVPIEDFGELEGRAYLVMPYLRVGSLTVRLREGPVGPLEGGRLVAQLAGALQHAHDSGVVHRDVKPSNILLDEQGNALLSDFGLARNQEVSISLTGSMLVGTPAYMSPEQVRGERAEPASDQYSLGIILYLLTTGRLPFEGETPMAVALKQLHDPIPLIRPSNARVPEAVEAVILKATAKNPEDRFESVAKLNEAFQGALAHALDPLSHPAPRIVLPGSVRPTAVFPAGQRIQVRSGGIGWRRALTGALILAALLTYPVLASGSGPFQAFQPRALPAGIGPAGGAPAEVTALAGTIEALSTELAGSRGAPLSSAGIQTAVVQTLEAVEERSLVQPPLASPEATATRTLRGSDPAGNALTPLALWTPPPTRAALPTATATATPTPPPTSTPTALPSPTVPPTPLASNTPPPTATPTPVGSSCGDYSLDQFAAVGKEVQWEVGNGTAAMVNITRILIDWPASHLKLEKIRLAGSQIWKAGSDGSPSDIASGWQGNRSLSPGQSKTLTFEFKSPSTGGAYSLLVEIDAGCQLSANG